jgi:hypothetical protein
VAFESLKGCAGADGGPRVLPARRFAQSGADKASSFQFLRALLILPEDQIYNAGRAPPYAQSASSFMASDPGRPVIVRLQTQVRRARPLRMRLEWASANELDSGGARPHCVQRAVTAHGAYWHVPSYVLQLPGNL